MLEGKRPATLDAACRQYLRRTVAKYVRHGLQMVNEWGESRDKATDCAGDADGEGGSCQRPTEFRTAAGELRLAETGRGWHFDRKSGTLRSISSNIRLQLHRMIIHSERLDLIPLTPEFMRASLNQELVEAERILGVSLPTDWPDCPRLLEMRLKQLEEDPSLQPWLLRTMVLRSNRAAVGHIGFHEAPGPEHYREIAPGAAEFGFTVYSPFQRRGYAREASLALMQWAHQSQGVTRFVLTIRPDNAPSQALASQLGFVRIGSHIDEIDGLEDILELRVEPDESCIG
jgi:[ribosomal protein S5]-alanine N-acetyltransferase